MLRIASLVSLALIASCVTSAGPDFDQRLSRLLEQSPDDPDVLFLLHDRNLAVSSKLADRRPEPMVLAAVVTTYVNRMNEDDLPKFSRVLAQWQDRDPENAMPFVLKGLLELSEGRLNEGLESMLGASRRRVLRTYSMEILQETWRLQQNLGLDDIISIVAVFRHTGATLALLMLKASRFLQAVSLERELRGDMAGAAQAAAIDCELWQLFDESNRGETESLLATGHLAWMAGRECELRLMLGDEEAADRLADLARRAWRDHKILQLAAKRTVLDDPMSRLIREEGLIREAPDENPWKTLQAMSESFMTEDFWTRFYALLRANEPTLRPYLESRIRDGNRAYLLSRMTDADRKELAAMTCPIDRFWNERSDHYPERMSPEQMQKLIDVMVAPGQTDEVEFASARAFHALFRGADGSTLARLGTLLKDLEGNVDYRAVVLMTAMGVRSNELKEAAARVVDAFNPGSCWAAARLGLTAVIPKLLEDVLLEIGSLRRIGSGFDEAIPLYFALRDLTKQDFGFDGERWRAWGEGNGHLKPDD